MVGGHHNRKTCVKGRGLREAENRGLEPTVRASPSVSAGVWAAARRGVSQSVEVAVGGLPWAPRSHPSPFLHVSSREPYPFVQECCARTAELPLELGSRGAGCHGSSLSWKPCSLLPPSGMLNHEPISPWTQSRFGVRVLPALVSENKVPCRPCPSSSGNESRSVSKVQLSGKECRWQRGG